MTDSDDQLWQRCASGDAAALGELYRRHARALYAHAFRITADWMQAEDVVSVAFLEAWRRRDADVTPGMVPAWLHGVVVNVARNEQRSRRRAGALLQRFLTARAPAPPFDEQELAERLDDQARMRDLHETVRGLSVGEREAIALCWWSQLTYQEAAVALGVPIGTIRSRLSRARIRLLDAAATPAPTTTCQLTPEVDHDAP